MVVGRARLELAISFENTVLSRARIPIPPPTHDYRLYTRKQTGPQNILSRFALCMFRGTFATPALWTERLYQFGYSLPACLCSVFLLSCPPTRNRTWDPLLKRQLLYQLSYGREREQNLNYTVFTRKHRQSIGTGASQSKFVQRM